MIKLTKDSIIYSNDLNPECDKYIEKEVPYLWPYLSERVELSDDFTLGDLFNYIERNIDEFDLIFSSDLGHHSLQLYIDDVKELNLKKDTDTEIDFLEIQRYGEYWEEWGEIELHIEFHGVNEKEDIGYAIEFTPLNELKDLPLRLNENFSISRTKIPIRIVVHFVRLLKKIGIPLKKWDNPYTYAYVRGKTCFTVYELISSVLYEISFSGSPGERDAKLSEIIADIEDAKKKYKEE